MSAFDFRDMLGGASAIVSDPDVKARKTALSGAIGLNCLARSCAANGDVPIEHALGWMLATVVALANEQQGRERAFGLMEEWQRLFECLRAPGGMDRG